MVPRRQSGAVALLFEICGAADQGADGRDSDAGLREAEQLLIRCPRFFAPPSPTAWTGIWGNARSVGRYSKVLAKFSDAVSSPLCCLAISGRKPVGLLRGLRIKLGLKKKESPPPLPGVEIGRHTYGLENRSFWAPHEKSPLRIGSFCSVGPDVLFVCAGEHRIDTATTYPLRIVDARIRNGAETFSKGPTTVGNDVWFGARCIILSGVTIGNGAVIGAGSIVTRDIPPYAVAVGNPARVIRYRFSPEIIERLQSLAWWNWSDDLIRERVALLTAMDVERFLNALGLA
ncbi:MAG: CatB-related O-acetyltransferase [Mesorhizobium sp.]|nr:CatB-related O-acetyltransferase [Mesorhizobium sp. M00.F.Ca.ET.186.01.1.1]TJW32637.1 MAG: CatB-related O-acetyltransferase [Mesorhizobium sp.]